MRPIVIKSSRQHSESETCFLAHCDQWPLDVTSAKIPRIKALKTMDDGSKLDNARHRWLEADPAQNCMRGCKHHVGNVGWYELQSSSPRRCPSEIRGAKKDVQDGRGPGWQAKGRYLRRLKLVFEQEHHESCKWPNR